MTKQPSDSRKSVLAAPPGRSNPFWTRPGAFVASCAIATAVAIVAFAGASVSVVLYHLLSDGLIVLAWLLACYGIGALLPLPSETAQGEAAAEQELSSQSRDTANPRSSTLVLSPTERGADRVLVVVSQIALGLGVVSLLTLGLGLLGALSRLSAVAIVVIGISLAIMQGRKHLATKRTIASIEGSAWLWLLVAPLLGLSLVAAMVPPGVLWGDEPNGYDVVEYHLQIPREWHEAGRIKPLEHNVFSYFPFNVEMHDLLAMHLLGGPFEAMFLAQLMHVAWGVLFVAAVYAVVRVRSSRTNATIAALAAAAVPWTTLLTPIVYNESGLLLFGTLAIGWALRSIDSASPYRDLIVAGAMAGFAAGVKLTAIPILCIMLPLAAVIPMIRCASTWASLVGRLAVFATISAAVFAPWALRNAVWTGGNPVFPEGQSILGRGHFSEVQTERWKRAHSPRTDQQSLSARIDAFVRQIMRDWRFGYLVLPLGMMAFVLGWRKREAWTLAILFAGLIVFWIGFTHLQGRFFVLAIPMSAMMIGLVDHRIARRALMSLVCVAVVIGFAALVNRWNELDASIAGRTGGEIHLNQLLGLSVDRWAMAGRDPLRQDQTLVLVGDAEAFLYQMPMKRLRYRTVFDVDTSGDQSIIEAWAEGATDLPDRVILVDRAALRRFHATYFGIPPLPGDLASPGDQPFILDQPGVRIAP